MRYVKLPTIEYDYRGMIDDAHWYDVYILRHGKRELVATATGATKAAAWADAMAKGANAAGTEEVQE